MTHADYGYGLWGLALVNAAVFILFAFSFFKPATKRDWRSLGAFSAFIIALFAEMYGFPLTIFVLSGGSSRISPLSTGGATMLDISWR
jgi:hypothetical protein